MEQTAFHILQRPDTKKADAVNDLFAAIRIGDSRPLSTEDLVLCLKPDGEEKDLPLARGMSEAGNRHRV